MDSQVVGRQARSGLRGLQRKGGDRLGMFRRGRLGLFWLGEAPYRRLGLVRYGPATSGVGVLVGSAEAGMFRNAMVSSGKQRQARLGSLRWGKSGWAWNGRARCVPAGQDWLATAWSSTVRLVEDRQDRHGILRPGLERVPWQATPGPRAREWSGTDWSGRVPAFPSYPLDHQHLI